MLVFAGVFYLFMCWISNWNLLWPLKMLSDGGIGDWLIVIVWVILLAVGLSN